MQGWRRILGIALLGGIVVAAGLFVLRGAAERNVYALQLVPLVNGIEWADETQICEPLAPPPALMPRPCTTDGDCYLSSLLALRRGEWDNVQTLTGAAPDPLMIFLRGWSEQCTVSPETAIATWSMGGEPIRHKFLAEAQAALAQDRDKAALAQVKISHALRPSAESFLTLAAAQDALEQDDDALGMYYEAIERDMTTPRTFGELGYLESQLGILQAARAHLEQAVRLDPRSGHYWQTLGGVLYRMEDWAGSENAFAHAAELLPDFGPAHGGVALTQLRLGKLEQGRQAVEATMKTTTDAKQQAGYLGSFAEFAADAGDLEYAAELYSRALGRTPNNQKLWDALLQTYARLGECDSMQSVYQLYQSEFNAPQATPAPLPVCPA